jgi:hypothetical protein
VAARLADLEFCVCCDVQVVYSRPRECECECEKDEFVRGGRKNLARQKGAG